MTKMAGINVKCVLKGDNCNAVKVSSEEGEVTIDPRECLKCGFLKGESSLIPVFTVNLPRPQITKTLFEPILPVKPPLLRA